MRSLIFVPAMHDFGDALPGTFELASSSPELLGVIKELQDILWTSVDREISKIGEDFRGVKVFPEALTENLPTPEMVMPFSRAREVAEAHMEFVSVHKARNSVLVDALRLAGATIVPTEDKELIKEGRMLIYRKEIPLSAEGLAEVEAAFNRNREARDTHYVDVINKNLYHDELGIFIAGSGHRAVATLPDDINVNVISEEAFKIWQRRNPEGHRLFLQRESRRGMKAGGVERL